jgi:hypothetical protein
MVYVVFGNERAHEQEQYSQRMMSVSSINDSVDKTNMAVDALHSGDCLRAVVKY